MSLAAASIACAAACTQAVSVSSRWHEERPAGAPYSRILIVAVSKDIRLRRRFEDDLVQELERSGNSAWASSRIMPVEEALSRESVTRAVAAVDANAVAVTRLVSRDVTAEETAARTRVKTRRKDEKAYDFFRYDYEEYEEPVELRVRSTAVLETDVYEVAGGQLLFSIETTSYDKESDHDVADEVSVAVARRLRREKLVR